jgi:hypothetical protein
MFNELQKNRYLENCKYEPNTIESSIKVLFNKSELAEMHFEKDLCDFNRLEIIDMFKGFDSKSHRYLYGACLHFSEYYTWCQQEGLTNNNINEFAKNMVWTIIKEVIPPEEISDKFFGFDQIIQYLNNLTDFRDKFVLYAIWLGIKGKNYSELINIKMSDYNEETKELSLKTGRKIKVDDIFYNIMWQADDSLYYKELEIENESKRFMYKYVQNGYVLKSRNGDEFNPVNPGLITTSLLRIKEECGNKFISQASVYSNGMINFIKNKYKENYNIGLTEVFTKKDENGIYKYDTQTQDYIDEFGSKTKVRYLRNAISDYYEFLE